MMNKHSHPLDLPRGELGHGRIVNVVHEVVERRHDPAGAVRAGRLHADAGMFLRRRVVDIVAGRGAASLERVKETEVMADLVYGRLALIERTDVLNRWDGFVADDHAVQLLV